MMPAIATASTALTAAPAMNLASLSARWLAYLDVSPRTADTYTRAIRVHLSYLAEHGITRPTRADIIAYRDSLMATGHRATTVSLYMAAVRLMYAWLATEGLYPDVAAHVKGGRAATHEHRRDALTASQTAAMLAGIDRSTLAGLRDYAMLSLMATTGLRCVSVAAADIDDIRTVAGTAVLYYRGKGRGEKAAYVHLAEPVDAAIRAYLAARGVTESNAPLFAAVSNHGRGGRMTTRSISRVCKQAMAAAGMVSSRLTAHSLRHTAATLNLLAGGTLAETQQLLDHRSITTTQIYAHALQRAANMSECRVAGQIFG